MGNRKLDKLFEKYPWLSVTETWGNTRGVGRWYKRRLSKARRRYAKQVLKTGRTNREPVNIESETNWKGW